ncbi:MAG: alanine racemase [Candidatus Woesebacteria bacterium]
MYRRLAIAKIDLSAYSYNLQEIRKLLSPATKIMAVVKANAYGHGAIEIAKTAQKLNIDYLGVVCLYEAQELRNAGVTLPILILNAIDTEAAYAAIDLDVSLTVMDQELLMAVDLYTQKKGIKAKVHVKIDSGMHRAGVSPEDAIPFIQKVEACAGVTLEGVFTHFAMADDADLTFTKQQLSVFTQIIEELKKIGITPPLIHAANSAATLKLPESHFSLVRPGIISYGLHPNPGAFDVPFTPKPVMRLQTQIVQLREIAVGESVGYGRTFVAKRPTKVALLALGYGDGFRRAPQNFGEVLVRGMRAPLIGRVSMDQSSIDVTDIPNVSLYDEVVLIGSQGSEEISADDVAQKIGTINYEVMTGIAARVERVYS